MTPSLRLTASGFVEGLLASRPDRPVVATGEVRNTTTTDAVIRVHDAFAELTADASTSAPASPEWIWGRLDEVQPTDVVNPLDVSRFFEGRGEARLPVALIRASVFLSDAASVEAVYAGFFRRGRYDLLDEPTSPFTPRSPGEGLAVCLAIGCPTLLPEVVDDKPSAGAPSAQGGARVSATTGRVDWSVSAYRGLEPFAIHRVAESVPGAPVRIEGKHPRFTMIGGDVERCDEWGIRGEVAAFVDDNFQSPALTIAEGSSVEAGAGVDRKAGSYRFSGTVLFHRERRSGPPRSWRSRGAPTCHSCTHHGAQVCPRALRAARFRRGEHNGRLRLRARDRPRAPRQPGTGGILGWFAGEGRDLVGRFADSDFAYLRIKYYF